MLEWVLPSTQRFAATNSRAASKAAAPRVISRHRKAVHTARFTSQAPLVASEHRGARTPEPQNMPSSSLASSLIISRLQGGSKTISVCTLLICGAPRILLRASAAMTSPDRKSTRLNSSHVRISYAVFCLIPPPPTSTLFPYTTLFRSSRGLGTPGRQDTGTSEHAEFQPGLLAHHLTTPGRVEDDLGMHLADLRGAEDLVAGVGGDDVAHAAAGCGQRHADGDDALPGDQALDAAAVDQPQVDDIDRDLRVEAGAQLVPDELLDLLLGGVLGQGRPRQRLEAQDIQVGPLDQVEAPLEADAHRAALGLHDGDDAVLGQGHRLAEGDGDRLDVALQGQGLPLLEAGYLLDIAHGAPYLTMPMTRSSASLKTSISSRVL